MKPFSTSALNLLLLIAITTYGPLGRAQEEAKQPAADPFAIPEDASPRELFLFIKSLKRQRPAARTRDALTEHAQKTVDTIEKVADLVWNMKDATDRDQLLAMEEKFVAYSMLARVAPAVAYQKTVTLNREIQKDSRSVFVDVADFHLLQANISKTDRIGSEKTEVVDEIAAYVEKHGLDKVVLGYAESLGVRMSRAGENEAAAKLFGVLAAGVEKSNNQEMLRDLPFLQSTSRRLGLPGNFMEVTGNTADGKEFDWNSYRGKYVLVQFWATWCGPCRQEIPNIARHLQMYGDRGFAVVGVNLDEDRSAFDSFMQQSQLPWSNIVSDQGRNSTAERYAISSLPTLILVDPQGKVISMQAGGKNLGKLLAQNLGPVQGASVPGRPVN